MKRLKGNKNVVIRGITTDEEWRLSKIEDLNNYANYYKTTEERLNYLAELIKEVHYEECKNGVLPRLDRTVINFR